MKKLLATIGLVILLGQSNLQSQDSNLTKLGIEAYNGRIPTGLKEGDRAPDFTGYDQTGKQVTLKGFLNDGPVVLFFYRGNWCPACNKQLKAYQDSLNIITGTGARLVAITPESIDKVEQTVKLHNLTFTVIYDCMEQIMKDYDVMYTVTKDFSDRVLKNAKVDIAKHNGRDVAHLPVTATYIINRNGIITASYFKYDFYDRSSVNWIFRNLAGTL